MALKPMVRHRPEADRVRSALGASLGKILAIVPLESGTTGMSFRIDTPASQFVAKVFSENSDVLLGPGAQFALLEELSPTGIAPRPVFCEPSAGLLVTEFVNDAASVSASELRSPARIAQFAKLIRALHGVAADIPAFAPETYASRYVGKMGGRGALSQPDRLRFEELVDIAADMAAGKHCLCHNDLTADNILFGASPVLIDFDYAVLAPPIVDLASVGVMNSFAETEQSLLLSEYYRGREVPFSAAGFARVQRLVRLLSHFWSLASVHAEAAIVAQYRIEDV